MLSQVTISNAISGGQIYGFQYRAVNRQGQGILSDVNYFKAANVPDQMQSVTVTEMGMDFKVEWTLPDSGSLPIQGFVIEFQAHDESFQETTECNGFDSIIRQNLFCIVKIETMTSQPFSISQGTLIKVRISAVNSLGQGVPSNMNTEGVNAIIRPHKPQLSPMRGEGTSQNQLEIIYPTLEGEHNGGSSITSLHLQWDEGTDGQ